MVIVAKTPEDKAVAQKFLRDRGVLLADADDFNAIGRLGAEGQLLGVVGFTNFNGRTCAIHIAGDGNWISRSLLRATFHYPFVTCKLGHIVATISSANVRSMKLSKRIGFEVLFRLRNGWSENEDMVVLGMTNESCRWLAQERKDELKAA